MVGLVPTPRPGMENYGVPAKQAVSFGDSRAAVVQGKRMAKKTTKLLPWTKTDVRTLRTLAREKVKTSVIARKLKRSVGATYQQASRLGVSLGAR